MVEVIRWCLALGVRHVSVYAFSIENFARAPKEVGGLMNLAEKKYVELAAVSAKLPPVIVNPAI